MVARVAPGPRSGRSRLPSDPVSIAAAQSHCQAADQGGRRPWHPASRESGGADRAAGGRRSDRHGWCVLIEVARWCGGLGNLADQIDMGWFNRTTVEGGLMADQLTEQDRADFARFNEAVVRAAKAVKAVIEGGQALREIRQRQLYRHVAGSWEQYLALHGLNRRRADQLVAAAAVLEAVETAAHETGTVVPSLSERAIRPLVGLAPEEVTEAVVEAASSPDGITPASIRKAAGRRRKSKAAKAPRPRRFRVPGGIVVVQLNRKAAAAGIDIEAALAAALEAVRRDGGQAEAA